MILPQNDFPSSFYPLRSLRSLRLSSHFAPEYCIGLRSP
jgi:hypothetical protein